MEPTIGSPAQAASEQDRQLHARLLGKDPSASSDLANVYLPELVARLARAFRNVDGHLVEEAAIDAVLDVAQHPTRYDPARSSLRAYLYMAARGDLRNKLQHEQRRRRREVSLAEEDAPRVEHLLQTRNPSREDAEDPALQAERQGALKPGLSRVLDAAFTPREREIIELIQHGERRTSTYARCLGITHLSPSDQRREIKRVKDRLLKRLRRLAPRVKRDD
jgi:RNA polymerase sigma-70 factor (ECF subfamily)